VRNDEVIKQPQQVPQTKLKNNFGVVWNKYKFYDKKEMYYE